MTVPSVLFFLGYTPVAAQDRRLTDSLTSIAAASGGHLGVAITGEKSGKTTLFHGHDHQPMMSVFKFPIALYVLDQVDKGKLSLDESVSIRKEDWKTKSPMLDGYQQNVVHLTLRDLTSGMIILGDNVACDVLLHRIGGPQVVNDYIHGLGIRDIHIAWTEAQMAAEPKKVYENWCAPVAMNKLLIAFDHHRILSAAGTQQLKTWMIATAPGAHRLKAFLPAGTILIHRTGTSDTDKGGLTAATNDVGIIALPGGRHLYISVFLADSHADEATREAIIARTGRAAYASARR